MKNTNLFLLRTFGGVESTLGNLYYDGNPECFTLEDQFQAKKVKGETRIPDGRYQIKLREVVSPMTEKYRKKYPWFTYHLEIQNVRNFKNIYIHAGVTDDHTEGCLLVGDALYNNAAKVENYENGALMYSSQAYERLYKKVRQQLKSGADVYIDIYTYRA